MEAEQLARAERDAALRKLFLKETAESLDIAEINASLNAPDDGSNEKKRELQRKAAIANDTECQKCRADKSKAERLLIEADYAYTLAQKNWQAQQAQGEFEIARMNENASRMTLEAARLSLEAAKLMHSGGA
jgi:hypothetical protein